MTDIVRFELSLQSSNHGRRMLKDVVFVAGLEQTGHNIGVVPIGENSNVLDVLAEHFVGPEYLPTRGIRTRSILGYLFLLKSREQTSLGLFDLFLWLWLGELALPCLLGMSSQPVNKYDAAEVLGSSRLRQELGNLLSNRFRLWALLYP